MRLPWPAALPILLLLSGLPAFSETLACGSDLQAAIDHAKGPSTITVAHLKKDGLTRCNWGSYTLPWRPDNAIVTIQTDGKVPVFGTRTHPGDSYLALFTANCKVGQGYYEVFFPAGTAPTKTPGHPPHGYTFIGLELTAPNDTACSSYGIVTMGGYTTGKLVLADLPYQFTFSHCYIHGGGPDQEVGRGISLVGNNLTVNDSTISEIHSTFIESNTIYGCTMQGNWTIENNDLQAAAENLLICGSEGQIFMPAPKNITIRYNYIHKPVEWRNYTTRNGGHYIMKNLLEFKATDGAVIDSNVFEYSWVQSQQGYAMVFTPRYLIDGLHTVKNITITNNVIRHVAMGMVIGLYDDNTCPKTYPMNKCLEAGGGSENFTVRNNLFDDVSGDKWGGGESSYLILMTAVMGSGITRPFTKGLVIDHNTFISGGANINSCDLFYTLAGQGPWPPSQPATAVEVSYNVFPYVMCRDAATGPTAIIPGTKFHHNSMAISFNPQPLWDQAFPGQKNFVTPANPDGRGANIKQLETLEAKVRAGTRPK